MDDPLAIQLEVIGPYYICRSTIETIDNPQLEVRRAPRKDLSG